MTKVSVYNWTSTALRRRAQAAIFFSRGKITRINLYHSSVPYLADLVAVLYFSCTVLIENSKTVTAVISFANNAFVIIHRAISFRSS